MKILFSSNYYYLCNPTYFSLAKHLTGNELYYLNTNCSQVNKIGIDKKQIEDNGFIYRISESYPEQQLSVRKLKACRASYEKYTHSIEEQINTINPDVIIVDSDLCLPAQIMHKWSVKSNIPFIIIQTCLIDFFKNRKIYFLIEQFVGKLSRTILNLPLNRKQSVYGLEFDDSYLFLWGEYFRSRYAKRKNVYVLGNATFENLLNFDKYILEDYNFRFKRIPNGKTVLICTEFISGVTNFSYDTILEIYKKLSIKHSDINFIIKIHPREDESIYSKHLGSLNNLAVIKKADLYSLFKISDLQMSFVSTTSLEAAAFGLPVVLFGFLNEKYLQSKYQEHFFMGIALKANYNDVDDISSKIDTALSDKYKEEFLIKRDSFINNMFTSVDQNISKRIVEKIMEIKLHHLS